MTALTEQFDTDLEDALARCTSCGKCHEVCPNRAGGRLAPADGAAIVDQVKHLTRGGDASSSSADWVEACTGSGECNDVCPENINVRRWLSILNLKRKVRTRPKEERRAAGDELFRTMAQAVRLLASMQMPNQDRDALLAPGRGRKADLVFYYGCNILRSPHLIFNVMDILDAIGIEHEVIGGTANCCGVLQYMSGDLGTYERIAGRTAGTFEAMGAKEVLSWCPTCQIQFGENYNPFTAPSFEMGHVTEYLAGKADLIRPRIKHGLKKRAVIHEHGGVPGVVDGTRKLMHLVPDLEIVDVPQNREFGYQCSRVVQDRAVQEDIHRQIAENALAAGVDLIITIYHGCHRQLAGAEGRYPYEVKNFTDVLAEALGAGRPDYYKQYKKGGDIETAVASAEAFLVQNGISLNADQVAMLKAEIFGEIGIGGSTDGAKADLSYST
jgi:heterodisulfide reductase subunit D